MAKDERAPEKEFDISVFEIPPFAAYFETIQQLQKLSAKLDVLLDNQCKIMAMLGTTAESEHLEEARREIARRYEEHLAQYFSETGIERNELLSTIHADDRVREEGDV